MSGMQILVRPDLVGRTEWVSTIAAVDTTAAPETHVEHHHIRTYQFAGSQWIGGRDIVVPIHVQVDLVDADTFVVTDEVTGIFGAGMKLSDALSDFRAALNEHRDTLLAADTLSNDLHDQLAYLNQHLRPAE